MTLSANLFRREHTPSFPTCSRPGTTGCATGSHSTRPLILATTPNSRRWSIGSNRFRPGSVDLRDHHPHTVTDLAAAARVVELEAGGQDFARHELSVGARPVLLRRWYRHHHRDTVRNVEAG